MSSNQPTTKKCTRDEAEREVREQCEARENEFVRPATAPDDSDAPPVKGERVLEYRAKIEKERTDVIKQPMQAEEFIIQKQKLALQKDGHKEKIASFKTPEQVKTTTSGRMAREKILDETTVKREGPMQKVSDVLRTDGVHGERVQVFKKPIEKEHIEVYKEELQQEKVVVAKQKLAMKPVGKEETVEVLDTDDMATGAHELAATTTKTKRKGSLHKTLDILSTENETGEQRILFGEDVEKVVGHKSQEKKEEEEEEEEGEDSTSLSSSQAEEEESNESESSRRQRERKHKKHHHHHAKSKGEEADIDVAVAEASDDEKTVVAAAVAKDVGTDREEVKIHVAKVRPVHG